VQYCSLLLTPLLIASTTVIAVQPLASARSNNNRTTALTAFGAVGGNAIGYGCPPLVMAAYAPRSRTIMKQATH
jgi:hypothetical protein